MARNKVLATETALHQLRAATLYGVSDEIPPPLAHLADAVKSRRRGLGLTREALRLAGGPSDSTLARIENPEPTTAFPRPSTLARLDVALTWEPGSAASCLDLKPPRPISRGEAPDEKAVKGPPTVDPLDFAHVAVPAEVIREGLDLVQRLSRSERVEPALSRELSVFAHHLGAAHATEVLERFVAAGKTVPGFLLTTFGPYLTEGVSDDEVDTRKQPDQEYRRWLAGLAVDDDGRFHDRLQQKIRAIGYFAD